MKLFNLIWLIRISIEFIAKNRKNIERIHQMYFLPSLDL